MNAVCSRRLTRIGVRSGTRRDLSRALGTVAADVGESIVEATRPLRMLPRILLTDSPIAATGSRYATAVGFVWGFLWSTGAVERRHGLFVFSGMPRFAFGRGGTCVGGCYLTDRNIADDVLQHEAVHLRQWRRYGMLFPVLYARAGRDPLRNRFEIEAGLEKGGYLR